MHNIEWIYKTHSRHLSQLNSCGWNIVLHHLKTKYLSFFKRFYRLCQKERKTVWMSLMYFWWWRELRLARYPSWIIVSGARGILLILFPSLLKKCYWIFLCILKFDWENAFDVDRVLFMVMKKSWSSFMVWKWFECEWLINWDSGNDLKRRVSNELVLRWFWK